MEFELSDEAVNQIASMLTKPSKEGEEPEELDETIATVKLNGHVQLRGFSKEFTNRISSNIKFRIDAVNMGSRVRIIIDVQK